MTRTDKLYLTICNYAKEPVCDLYDNQSDISGQAANVFIAKERNGWKELSFDIPSTISTEEGIKENCRLDYLIAEYKIRAIDDNETDWYIISEPKITRDNFSKNVSVKAGHISQLLKQKNLDLEFSDEEGNNVGTAEMLLEAILDGTDWNVGNVGIKYKKPNGEWAWHTFLEDDGKAKHRSITAQAGTGCLGLIEKLCDVFEAKPVYHGDTQTIDILPMNPFAKIDAELIPATIRDEELNVFELYYNRNIHNLTKTTNTENMATRLYAYGSSGDMNGACTLQNVIHHEWIMSVSALGKEYHFQIGDVNYFFSGDVSIGDTIIWSDMDLSSMSYVYNDTKKIAYRVYKEPKTSNYGTLETTDPIDVKNSFAYLLAFNYYDEVGLMTEEQFQEIAYFQRTMPVYFDIISENNEAFIDGEAELSKIAEHATGLLKLEVQSVETGSESKFIINTSAGENGVLYRTDYQNAERRYFMWHVTDKLNEYGDPITGTPSLLFIVHDTDPVTYEMTYLKKIWDVEGPVLNDEGQPKDFEYSTGNYPTAFTVWGNYTKRPGDRFYLFCTNSMAGLLGSRLAEIEAVYQNLDKITMKHPVTFFDGDAGLVIPTPSNSEYEWMYKYFNVNDGELYFCWKDKFAETSWKRVYIADLEPAGTTGYFYNTRRKTLHRWDGSSWFKIEDKQITTQMFESVIYYCKRRDELYHGIYEYYLSNGPKDAGNYAIFDGYNAYWAFKLNSAAENNIMLDYINNHHIFTNVTFDGNEPDIKDKFSASSQHVESRAVFYPAENELINRLFYPGSISTSDGTDISLQTIGYRTAKIPITANTRYYYRLPVGSSIYLYNSGMSLRNIVPVTATQGNFIDSGAVFMRVVVPEVQQTSYIKIGSEILTDNKDDLLNDRPFTLGSIDNNGNDKNVDRYKTYNIPVYENTVYEYRLPAESYVYYYDVNLNFLGFDPLAHGVATGQFTTKANTSFIRITCSTNNLTGYYVRMKDYNKKFYMNREAYYILDNIQPKGELIGITPLTKRFADLADTVYEQYLANLRNAQENVKNMENNFAVVLGDMLKDGRWQDANYISGDEDRLYADAFYMHRQVSRPEITYSFTYLEMFGNKNPRYYETNNVKWPRIDIVQMAHLVDEESNTNCWAYIDKVNRCYDQPWETTVDIDTKLTLASRHGFTDVIARIAEVAKSIKAKQALYDRVVNGTVDGSRVEGVIDLMHTYLNGGSSNWYTDDKGNIILEASDGLSAVQISGRGIGISTEKQDDGSWRWRSALTGYGIVADTITTGYLSADRIEAGAITTDKLSSTVGKELEISSNKALLLFATEDGSRPAGSLKTTDGFIEIVAGHDSTPAKINVVSGGELNLNGGNVNIYSEGTMDISSGGVFTLKAQGADSIDTTVNGLYVNSEEGINFAGGRFVVKAHGDTSSVVMKADILELGQKNSSIIKMDAAHKSIDIYSSSTVDIHADQKLSLTTNGTIEIGNGANPFTIGAVKNTRAYIYNGPSSIGAATDGAYYGTDGLYIRGTSGSTVNFIRARKDGNVEISGKITARNGSIGSWTIDQYLYSGSGDSRVGLGVYTKTQSGQTIDTGYRIWAGDNNPKNAEFSVKSDGTVKAIKGIIGGWNILSDYIGNANTKEGSTVGMAYYATNVSNSTKVFWAGGAYSATTTETIPKFYVTKGGFLHAVDADITGSITSSTITGGSINIKSGTFKVDTNGNLTATSATITGAIKSGSTITGATIEGGSINIKSGKFKVDTEGNLTATSATITGAIQSGSTITGSTITGGSINIGNGSFEVRTDGKIIMKAGWYIDPSDFVGPLNAAGTAPNNDSFGYIQINCNPQNPYRIVAGNSNEFRVGGDGSVYTGDSVRKVYFITGIGDGYMNVVKSGTNDQFTIHFGGPGPQ